MCSEDLFPEMNRQRFLRLGGAGLAGAVLLGTTGGRVLARTAASLQEELETAAAEYRIPVDLLLAMGYVNTLWEMPPPGVSDYREGDLHGRGAYGIMQLVRNPWRDTLGKATELTGLTEEQLKNDRAANVRGGAAVLAYIQGEEKPVELDGWQDTVAEYGDGLLYATQVYETLEEGASGTISTGETLELKAQDVEVPHVFTAQAAPDYRRAVWRPAYGGNYTKARRERSHNINRIVLHVAEGSYAGTINWFQDPRSNVSAHYVVNRKGRIAQCVRHKDIAWHAGDWWFNKHSIGIEHEGYGRYRRTWTARMYRASAKLAAYVARRHNVPVDRKHIVRHRQVVATKCPGKHFDYDRYLRLVRRYK